MLDIPNSSESGGVDVKTVMSFTFSWLRTLGLLDQTQNANEDNYHNQCEEALKYIRTGTLTREEIDRKLRDEWFQFEYDAILVDEAQDWPQSEADLIAEIYGANTISIADDVLNWSGDNPLIGSHNCRTAKLHTTVFC